MMKEVGKEIKEIEITILFPCLNEEKTISTCVYQALDYLRESVFVNNKIKTGIKIVIVAFAAFIVCYSQIFYSFDKMITDRIYQVPSVTNNNIKIIAIDERTMQNLGNVSEWSREIPAKLVEVLNEEEENAPAVIGFDIMYISEKDEQGDAAFAKACKEAGNVVTAVNVVTNTQDRDGYIRYGLWETWHQEEKLLSLAAKIYEKYCQSQGVEMKVPELISDIAFGFTFSGKSGSYEVISLCDVLEGKTKHKVSLCYIVSYLNPMFTCVC